MIARGRWLSRVVSASAAMVAAGLAAPRQTVVGVPSFAQTTIEYQAPRRGCHLITSEVEQAVPELRDFETGLCNVFVQHTSCSLTINENWDPTVREDMERALNRIVPAEWNRDLFEHTMEGDDDMPGHVKATLVGASLNIPIKNGRLALGTWQGIYLCEHRDMGGYGGGHRRSIVITLNGVRADRATSEYDPNLTFVPEV